VQLARKYQPDVILCDLYLPDEDGFEVLRAVRANRMTMDTFFVVVTASISEADRLKCQELGVDQFIRKPVSAENIKLLISNYLKLSMQRSERIQKEKLTRKARIDTLQEKQPPFETRFAVVLEELYQDPGTTIENIQTRLSLSYATLMSRCKEAYGKSPKRLLIEKRIEVACKLLLDSDYKIGLISELAGFSTHSQFAIVFRKETGVTAAAFRRDNSAT
jgi:AraC-like DNA-binding protein